MKTGVTQLGGVRVVVAGIAGSVMYTLDGQLWPTRSTRPLGDSLLRRVRKMLLRWAADRNRRRARTGLGALDDRMLRDLGIERDQLAVVVEDFANKQLRERSAALS